MTTTTTNEFHKKTNPDFLISQNEFLDNTLRRLLIHYKTGLLERPYTPNRSQIIDCCDYLIEALEGENG